MLSFGPVCLFPSSLLLSRGCEGQCVVVSVVSGHQISLNTWENQGVIRGVRGNRCIYIVFRRTTSKESRRDDGFFLSFIRNSNYGSPQTYFNGFTDVILIVRLLGRNFSNVMDTNAFALLKLFALGILGEYNYFSWGYLLAPVIHCLPCDGIKCSSVVYGIDNCGTYTVYKSIDASVTNG